MLKSILIKTLAFMQVNAAELLQNHLWSKWFSEEWIFSGLEYFTLRAEIFTFENIININHD